MTSNKGINKKHENNKSEYATFLCNPKMFVWSGCLDHLNLLKESCFLTKWMTQLRCSPCLQMQQRVVVTRHHGGHGSVSILLSVARSCNGSAKIMSVVYHLMAQFINCNSCRLQQIIFYLKKTREGKRDKAGWKHPSISDIPHHEEDEYPARFTQF